MASIDKRPNGRWRARYREVPNGPQRTKTFPRKIDAERFLTKIQHDLMTGQYVDPSSSNVTLADYAARWLERMRPAWAPRTAVNAESSLRRHVLPALGRRSLAALRRSDFEALYASLSLAPGTVARVHQPVVQMLSAAVDDGLVARNPASRAKLPRQDGRRAQPVPLDAVARIEAELPDWMRGAVPLALGAGLRLAETTGLTIGRVDFLRRQLRVDRQLVGRSGGTQPRLAPPKTRSSNRTVPLADYVLDGLAAHLQRWPGGPNDLVLRTPAGEPVHSSRFGYRWSRACAAAELPDVRFHDLRHTYAATLLSKGVNVKAVASWLGHSSPVVTLHTYSHLMPADDEVGRRVIDEAFADRAEDSLRTSEQPSAH